MRNISIKFSAVRYGMPWEKRPQWSNHFRYIRLAIYLVRIKNLVQIKNHVRIKNQRFVSQFYVSLKTRKAPIDRYDGTYRKKKDPTHHTTSQLRIDRYTVLCQSFRKERWHKPSAHKPIILTVSPHPVPNGIKPSFHFDPLLCMSADGWFAPKRPGWPLETICAPVADK